MKPKCYLFRYFLFILCLVSLPIKRTSPFEIGIERGLIIAERVLQAAALAVAYYLSHDQAPTTDYLMRELDTYRNQPTVSSPPTSSKISPIAIPSTVAAAPSQSLEHERITTRIAHEAESIARKYHFSFNPAQRIRLQSFIKKQIVPQMNQQTRDRIQVRIGGRQELMPGIYRASLSPIHRTQAQQELIRAAAQIRDEEIVNKWLMARDPDYARDMMQRTDTVVKQLFCMIGVNANHEQQLCARLEIDNLDLLEEPYRSHLQELIYRLRYCFFDKNGHLYTNYCQTAARHGLSAAAYRIICFLQKIQPNNYRLIVHKSGNRLLKIALEHIERGDRSWINVMENYSSSGWFEWRQSRKRYVAECYERNRAIVERICQERHLRQQQHDVQVRTQHIAPVIDRVYKELVNEVKGQQHFFEHGNPTPPSSEPERPPFYQTGPGGPPEPGQQQDQKPDKNPQRGRIAKQILRTVAGASLTEVEVEELEQLFDKTIYGIEELKDTLLTVDYRHIFDVTIKEVTKPSGAIKRSLYGFHHDFMNKFEKSGIIKLIDKVYYSDGFYEARVAVDGIISLPKTFFPAHWTKEQVIVKTFEALKNASEYNIAKSGDYEFMEKINNITTRIIINSVGQIRSYPILKI